MTRRSRVSTPTFLIAVLLCVSSTAPAQSADYRSGRHLIVAVDRSGSRTPQQMVDMRAFMEKLVSQADFGDQISIIEVMQDGSSRAREFRDSVPALLVDGQPTRRESLIRDALLRSYRGQARKFVDTAGVHAIRSTDLFATLRRVSNYTSAGRRQYLILLSDMLQSTKGRSFDSAADVPDEKWMAAQQRAGMVPHLTGVCMAAVGVDDGTPRAARVKAFWMRYAKAAGASLHEKNYRASMDDAHIDCD
jgi:hypothetical protein